MVCRTSQGGKKRVAVAVGPVGPVGERANESDETCAWANAHAHAHAHALAVGVVGVGVSRRIGLMKRETRSHRRGGGGR